jgi:hypothetical protein
MADAIRSIGVTDVTYYRWRSVASAAELTLEVAPSAQARHFANPMRAAEKGV